MPRLGRVLRQTVFVIALQLGALELMSFLLPGFSVADLEQGLKLAAAIVLGNILLRPLLLIFTLPLVIGTLGLWSLVLNAVVINVAIDWVPGQPPAEIGTVLLLALASTVVHSLATVLSLKDDDDDFSYYFAHRLTARTTDAELVGPGLLMVEIDGLAAPILREAVEARRMPNLRRWLLGRQFEVREWWCELPTQTSSSQAGILYGDESEIPGFRWYDKSAGRMIESSDVDDAAAIARQRDHPRALLRGGTSIANLLGGGASTALATASEVKARNRMREQLETAFLFFQNPHSFFRLLVEMIFEVAVSTVSELRLLRSGGAHFTFPIKRAVTTVLFAEMTTFFATRELFNGTPAIYMTYVGYDVVAHYRGARSSNALRSLKTLDRHLARLRRAAQSSPREYTMVILSDHGQTAAVPFESLFEYPLAELVTSAARLVRIRTNRSELELTGHNSAIAAAESTRAAGFAMRSLLQRMGGAAAASAAGLAPALRKVSADDIVVCPSGNLANIYLTGQPGQLAVEDIADLYPELITTLANHPGIDFVITRNRAGEVLVQGAAGMINLSADALNGSDPLAAYPRQLRDSIRNLASYSNSGDLIVNGAQLESGQVVAFENQVSVHGGAGGEQSRPFLILPNGFGAVPTEIRGSSAVYQLLVDRRPYAPEYSLDRRRSRK